MRPDLHDAGHSCAKVIGGRPARRTGRSPWLRHAERSGGWDRRRL